MFMLSFIYVVFVYDYLYSLQFIADHSLLTDTDSMMMMMLMMMMMMTMTVMVMMMMMMMVMMVMMMMMMTTVVSVEQRPGWGEPV